jgi:predicted ATPase
MVARLIANGSLDANSMLFWDEPEANLNPRLIRRLAPLLLDLAEAGVQVFIATHSLFLMRALELERHQRGSLMAQFIGLKASAEGVTVQQGPSLTQSGDIIALTEDIQQAEQLLDQAMGVLP